MKNQRKETLSEQKLREEYEKMKKCASHKPGEEGSIYEQYFTPASVGMNRGRSVNNLTNDYNQKMGNQNSLASSIKPSEALDIALKRTLESGAPVNNMGFYDEVNWHLQTLGSSAQQPIVIKEAINKLLKKGAE